MSIQSILQSARQSFSTFVTKTIDGKYKSEVTIIVIAVFIVISLFSFGPNLDADWWIIDDHEIQVFSPTIKPMGFSQIIPTLLTKTELNPDSTLPRFRPVYYFLRLIETRLWNSLGPQGWYGARIVIFVFMLIVFYAFFAKLHGQWVGFLLSLSISSFPFWTDIFSRLGPSEVYCTIGVAIFLLGVISHLNHRYTVLSWIALFLGVVISVGSKETMGILIVPFAVDLHLYLRKKSGLAILPIVFFVLSIAWSVWIYTVVFTRIQQYGGDVYGNSGALAERFDLVFNHMAQQWPFYGLIGVCILVGLFGLVLSKDQKRKDLNRVLFLAAFSIFLMAFSQEVFYSGDIWGRYNYPYGLRLPLLASLLIYYGQQILIIHEKIRMRAVLLFIAILAIAVILINPADWHSLNASSKVNVNKTNYFMTNIQDAAFYLSTNPDAALIIYGNDAGSDYETAASYTRFLRSVGVSNPFYILRNPPADFETGLVSYEIGLEKELMRFSTEGNAEWTVSPLANFLENPTKCLLLTLNIDHPAPIQCDDNLDGDVIIEYEGLYKRIPN